MDMKLYHITENGRQELHRWLANPLQSQDYREPFLIQVYFAGWLSDEEFNHLLQQEIRAIEGRLAAYTEAYKSYQQSIGSHEDPRAYFLSVLTLEYGIMNNLAALEWLRSVSDRINAENYSLRDFPHEASIK